jgi:hypothetical protein
VAVAGAGTAVVGVTVTRLPTNPDAKQRETVKMSPCDVDKVRLVCKLE